MKFYPADWRVDAKLGTCPMAARGLWMAMICLMHEAEPYGHLVVNGVPMTDVKLAQLAGISLKECRKSLATLREVGVFSVSDAGVIYSRRMVRDEAKLLKDKENGKKGGNPDLILGVNPPVKAQMPETRS
ncbi:phage replisome organizer N-terminal domain-containing protein [Methylobacterium sp. E-065]|uniref:phage replisome organizer N-terminal domain-containing protein n=1 Tax=Methylobacterium sp. E-065 TaxID=2836583 RepID=UPI001FBB3778|nr:phage replisome organizer N-terminal domain-containing protein [Methylobacterium sp. E-065]MCJ2021189.1 phage replisome organizer N-terminal domain-containing protein [Methylobacterium sp. E-065]